MKTENKIKKAKRTFDYLHNFSVTNANIKILYTVTKMFHKNMAKNKIKIVLKKYPSEENFVMELLSITLWLLECQCQMMLLKSRKAFLLTLNPQISADLNRANDVLALIQEIVLA